MFLDSVGQLRTTKLSLTTTAQHLASDKVISRQYVGRRAVEINNTGSGTVYIGDCTVTSDTGLPVAAGASKIIPVNEDSVKNLYIVAGAAQDIILAEYFA